MADTKTKKLGSEEKQEALGPQGQEVHDYGYGEVTTTNYLTGDVSTRIFTAPWNQHKYFDVPGRGAQG